MVDLDVVRAAFEMRMAEIANGFSPVVPVEFENTPTPDTSPLAIAKRDKDNWIRFTLRIPVSEYVDISENPRQRFEGVATVNLFWEQNKGTKPLWQAMDRVTNGFNTMKLDNLQIRSVIPGPGGLAENWMTGNVVISFQYDDFIK